MRFLFVLGKYFPHAGANGVCVLRVQEELLKRGIHSDVIVEGETEQEFSNAYGTVYTVGVQQIGQMNKVQRVAAALRYPVYFPDNIRRYQAVIDKAVSCQDYVAIVAVLKPLDGAIAAARYTNLLIYELDSVANNDDNEHGFRKLLRYRTHRWERYLYKNAARVFHMQSHEPFYSQSRYDRFSGKSEYTDIPQLVDEKIEDRAANQLSGLNAVYSGILNRQMRSPEYLVGLIRELNTRQDLQLEANFYSRGNCEDFLETAQSETGGRVRKRGYVTLEALNQAVSRADLLLSIGNSLTGKVTSLPSKVISYMAYGKPVVHIDGGQNDIAKDYLKKYPLALVVDPKADFHENVKKLEAFLRDSIGKRVPLEDTGKLFEKNTPGYTAKKMLEAVDAYCSGTVKRR